MKSSQATVIRRKGSLSKFENIRRRILMYKNWYKIVFPFNRIFKGMQEMRLRNGKSIYVRSVRSMDVNIASDVLGNNEYELEQLWIDSLGIVFGEK